MNNKPMRSAIDWEAIEREYRAGQLSVAEIARRYAITEGAVRKRAKRDDWARDLAERVREAVRAKLVRADGTNAGTSESRARTEAEIVEAASSRGAALVELHREDIAQLDRLKRVFADRLEALLDGKPVQGLCLGDRETPADLLEKLSRVTQRSITLGRQAFNLDAADENPNDGWGALIDAVNQRVREKPAAERVRVIEHDPPGRDEGTGHPTGIKRLA